MTQYNEKPTKAQCGIRTAEQSGSMWRQSLSVYEMLILWLCVVATSAWRPREVYILKQYFLLGVITRGRSNLVPDQAGGWVCGLAVLEVRASGSWWTAIDWGERGDTVAVAQHWFSASAVVESRQNERAGPGGAARLSSQISGSIFFFVALTFPESKRYIYLDISSAATLDGLFQQLQQCFPVLIQYSNSAPSITHTVIQFSRKI